MLEGENLMGLLVRAPEQSSGRAHCGGTPHAGRLPDPEQARGSHYADSRKPCAHEEAAGCWPLAGASADAQGGQDGGSHVC